MPYKLMYEKRDGYLYFHVTGEDTLAVSKAYFEEIFETSRTLDMHHILIDEDLKGALSTMEIYELTESIPEMARGQYYKIAFIDKNSTNSEEQEFGVTVARNRGLDAQRLSSVSEGEAWLSS
ncbi:MAG TPA: hypothetical protein ENI65_00790 [Gammaproteobacteria bacterium]|nr:hypothetical protein [Gammaproteobacteria bacterium]